MKNINIILSIIITLFFLSACNKHDKDLDASGTFEATEVIVSAEANGKIMQLEATEGMKVKADEVLGFIDTTQLSLKREQLLASMNAIGQRRVDINKQMAAIEEQIATQKREQSRMEKLIAAKAGNQKQLDDINSSIAILQKQLAAQKSSLTNTNAGISSEQLSVEIQVKQIDDQIRKSYIVSPIAGTILQKYAEAGELTTMGKPLFKVANLEEMYLKAYITNSQLSQLKLGDSVTVISDYGEKGSRRYDGRVTWISDRSEFTPKTIQTKDERANLVYAIKVSVPNDGYLKIGMYGDLVFKKAH